jgi:hypothetical protein
VTTEHSGDQRVSLRPWKGELSKRQAFVSHGATVPPGCAPARQ